MRRKTGIRKVAKLTEHLSLLPLAVDSTVTSVANQAPASHQATPPRHPWKRCTIHCCLNPSLNNRHLGKTMESDLIHDSYKNVQHIVIN